MALRGKSMEQGPEWYKTLSKEVKELRGEVKELREEVEGMRAWRWAALRFMKILLERLHPDQHPPIPAELREDLDQSTH
ncbi:hypothetical protein [Corynebacterium sp.]|uniref:hypothetical protein n=1 Tax=Corynebacterium sp. TaxID=1720 RepID=UPI0028A8EFC2|nr:hypothetical protein [Corynebacterium sp.]